MPKAAFIAKETYLRDAARKRQRPECPTCKRPMDRERDVKGKFYTACYVCGYDSRRGPSPE